MCTLFVALDHRDFALTLKGHGGAETIQAGVLVRVDQNLLKVVDCHDGIRGRDVDAHAKALRRRTNQLRFRARQDRPRGQAGSSAPPHTLRRSPTFDEAVLVAAR